MQFTRLLDDQLRATGEDYPSLVTRQNIAHWARATGKRAIAYQHVTMLLPLATEILGPDHQVVLSAQGLKGLLRVESGDAEGGLAVFNDLLPRELDLIGPSHPHTLNTRNNISDAHYRLGDVDTALRLLRELLPDRVRIMGESHTATRMTRNNISHLEGLSRPETAGGDQAKPRSDS